MTSNMIDPKIFDELKAKLEEETAVRKKVKDQVDDIELMVAYIQGLLSKVHSTPRSGCMAYL